MTEALKRLLEDVDGARTGFRAKVLSHIAVSSYQGRPSIDRSSLQISRIKTVRDQDQATERRSFSISATARFKEALLGTIIRSLTGCDHVDE